MRRFALLSALVMLAACGSAEPAANSDPTTTSAAMETTVTSSPTTTEPAIEEPIPDMGPAPELVEIDGWLQTDIQSLDDLRGRVVVVEFWTFGCINCKHTLPYLEDLYAAHAGDDFEMVGVHSPEFDYEKDPDSILKAAADLGVTWPIALDTNKRSFFHWQGSPAYWPRIYVLDQQGHIRFDHVGEGGYDELSDTVTALLG